MTDQTEADFNFEDFKEYRPERVSRSMEQFARQCPEYWEAERERERRERERHNIRWLKWFYRNASDDLRRTYYRAQRGDVYAEWRLDGEALMEMHRDSTEAVLEIVRGADPEVIDDGPDGAVMRPLSELRGQTAHKVKCFFGIEKCESCRRWEARKEKSADSKADA